MEAELTWGTTRKGQKLIILKATSSQKNSPQKQHTGDVSNGAHIPAKQQLSLVQIDALK